MRQVKSFFLALHHSHTQQICKERSGSLNSIFINHFNVADCQSECKCAKQIAILNYIYLIPYCHDVRNDKKEKSNYIYELFNSLSLWELTNCSNEMLVRLIVIHDLSLFNYVSFIQTIYYHVTMNIAKQVFESLAHLGYSKPTFHNIFQISDFTDQTFYRYNVFSLILIINNWQSVNNYPCYIERRIFIYKVSQNVNM